MADGIGIPEGKEAAGSQTRDAGDPSMARGGAGVATGAKTGTGDQHDLEERRETEQVLRPTSDGMGDGLVKDQS